MLLAAAAVFMILWQLFNAALIASGVDLQVKMLEVFQGNMAGNDPKMKAEFDKQIEKAKNRDKTPEIAMSVAQTVVQIAGSIVVLLGALRMRALKSWGLALTGAILACTPCSGCCIVGLPFGIWALVVLNDASVKAAFQYVARGRTDLA
jgi:hypothetical protein